MSHTAPRDHRQQRAIDAIDRAAVDFVIAIKANAPDTEAVRQAQRALGALTDSVKAAIVSE